MNCSFDNVFDHLVIDYESVTFEVVSLIPAKHENVKEDSQAEISVPRFGTLLVIVDKSNFFGVRNVFYILEVILLIFVFMFLDESLLFLVESRPSSRGEDDDFINIQSGK